MNSPGSSAAMFPPTEREPATNAEWADHARLEVAWLVRVGAVDAVAGAPLVAWLEDAIRSLSQAADRGELPFHRADLLQVWSNQIAAVIDTGSGTLQATLAQDDRLPLLLQAAAEATLVNERIQKLARLWRSLPASIAKLRLSGCLARWLAQGLCTVWRVPLLRFSDADRLRFDADSNDVDWRRLALDLYTERIVMASGRVATRLGPLTGDSAMYGLPGVPAFVVQWEDL